MNSTRTPMLRTRVAYPFHSVCLRSSALLRAPPPSPALRTPTRRQSVHDAAHALISQVVAAISPKPGAGGPPGAGLDEARIALKVFVRFATTASALICAKELHGKQFDGRTVVAKFMSESFFEALQALPCFV